MADLFSALGASGPIAPPFTTFNFLVEIEVPNVSPTIASAAFSEADGLEMSIEPRTIREGGRNAGPIHLAGSVSYGQLTLKRGMTGNADLSNITWRGVVLIGGAAEVSGSATRVWGTMISGLNVKLGMTVPESSIGNGSFLVQYNSCDISSALNRLGGWQRIANTWTDNWPTY